MRTKLHTVLLIAAAAAGLSLAAQEGSRPARGASPPQRILTYWFGEADMDQLDLGRRNLKAFAEYVREAYPLGHLSIFENHLWVQPRIVHFFMEFESADALSRHLRASSRDDRFGELLDEQEQFLPPEGTVSLILRQVAGSAPAEAGQWARGRLVQWTARTRFGQVGRALEVAREMTEFLNTEGRDVRARAYLESLGSADKFHWFLEAGTQENWLRSEQALLEDPRWLEILERAGEVFLESSFQDEWLKPVH